MSEELEKVAEDIWDLVGSSKYIKDSPEPLATVMGALAYTLVRAAFTIGLSRDNVITGITYTFDMLEAARPNNPEETLQ